MAICIEEAVYSFLGAAYELIDEAKSLKKREAELKEYLEYEASNEDYSLTEIVEELKSSLQDAMKRVDGLLA